LSGRAENPDLNFDFPVSPNVKTFDDDDLAKAGAAMATALKKEGYGSPGRIA
jgi:hypothetical protein